MARNTNQHQRRPERWVTVPSNRELVQRLEHEHALPPLLARVLGSRGFENTDDARRFLDARLTDHLGDPFELKDMDRAADRVAAAVKSGEKTAIFGDFDVDGITSTVLLIRLLRWLGVEPIYYIPHRINEGYGMSSGAVDFLSEQGTQLLITVDNGISSIEEVEHAASLGIECVITDHHQVGETLPRALAVVNPNRSDCTYGFRNLSGVGVTFKLAHAVLRSLDVEAPKAKAFLKSCLDIVALGTVADIVPLVGENRALVRAGLQNLERTTNPGLAAMLSLDANSSRPFQAEVITYFLAPRLNAAGRTEHASLAVELLTTDDPERAIELAHLLDELNARRRAVERDIVDEAMGLLDEQCDMVSDVFYIIVGQDWHLGVLGIVASKLSRRFARPVAVLSEVNGVVRGSARSVPGFDIHKALTQCEDLLIAYGGHPEAAGLTLDPDRVDELRERLLAEAEKEMGDSEPVYELRIDAVCEADELSLDAVEDLQSLEPCGCGNPKPVFALMGIDLSSDPRIVGSNHLKFSVAGGAQDFEVIGFGMGELLGELRQCSGPIDLAFQPRISTWRGAKQVELQLEGFRPSE